MDVDGATITTPLFSPRLTKVPDRRAYLRQFPKYMNTACIDFLKECEAEWSKIPKKSMPYDYVDGGLIESMCPEGLFTLGNEAIMAVIRCLNFSCISWIVYSCTYAFIIYLHHLVLGSYKKYAWAIDPNADPQRSLVLAAAAAANDGPLNLS